jgi:hypothetical protein
MNLNNAKLNNDDVHCDDARLPGDILHRQGNSLTVCPSDNKNRT